MKFPCLKSFTIDSHMYSPLESCRVQVSSCTNGAVYEGDTFFRLYDPEGRQVAVDDDGCKTALESDEEIGSILTLDLNDESSDTANVHAHYGGKSNWGCKTFTLHLGCYSDYSCSSDIVINTYDVFD
jgi:hypothetical protein